MKVWFKKYRNSIVIICCCLLAIGGVITVALLGRNHATDKNTPPSASAPQHSSIENNAPPTKEEPTEKVYTLMDLGSRGCVPCDNLQPVLASLRTNYDGKINVLFYDVNRTTEGAKLAQQYNLEYLPTLIFLDENGKEVKRIIGFRTEEQIEQIFRELRWIE